MAMLAACAHRAGPETVPVAVEQVPGRSGAVDHVGAGIEALSASAVPDFMARESAALNKILSETGSREWQLMQLADGSIRLQSPGAVSFDAGSAQLRPSALNAYARIAQVVTGDGRTVVHVIAGGDDAIQAEFEQSLTERRAATVAAYLGEQGIDGARLRFEGSAATDQRALVLIIKPVVAGQEAQAWIPPS
jgi:outer membrane protein OmpA-like peptidoglycan-associated protein